MPIDRNKLDAQLILEEGFKLVAYQDTQGCLTIGVGRNLDTNPLTGAEIAVCGSNGRAGPITKDGAMLCLHNDEQKAIAELTINVPWWDDLDEVRGRVMIDLCFNMGWKGLSTFHHFLEDMQEAHYVMAAADLMDSLWYREVGDRGPRLVGMVRTGEDYTA